MNSEIEYCKRMFNRFFKDDLYNRFDNDSNIILSRGGWSDNYISFPKIFKFCIDYTFSKHWTGYSDPRGHKNTINAIVKLVNIQPCLNQYKPSNVSLTIGNVLTVGFVFRQLKNMFPDASVITLQPYYPPIVKSINYYFKKIHFLSSLRTEEQIIGEITKWARLSDDTKIFFLSNSIGVEGRIFSSIFWRKIIRVLKEKKMFLVIDEGMWFNQLEYCQEINNDQVVRIISLSKKYGLPGCKLGFMLAGENFISKFYECASTNYGGPLSVFFLFCEFLYLFEFIHYSGTRLDIGLLPLHNQYGIAMEHLEILYYDFLNTIKKNREKFDINKRLLIDWFRENSIFFESCYDFGGINVLFRPKTKLKSYNIFLSAIINEKVSIMPSVCLGDEHDSMFRITVLEDTQDLKVGLAKLRKIIKEIYEKQLVPKNQSYIKE